MVPMITISCAELRGLGGLPKAVSRTSLNRDITYQMEWGPVINYCPSHEFTAKEVRKLEAGDMSPEEKETLLTRTASLYMDSLLKQISNNASAIPHKHHVYLVRWMKEYRNSETCRKLIDNMTGYEVELALRQVRSAGVEGEMVSRIGRELTRLIAGELKPLSVMLEDNLLYRVYGDDSSVRCYKHLIEYLRRLTFTNPYLKVLEVGAGTGGTTLPLLQAHNDSHGSFFGHYDYTDISSGFFEQVQPTLKEWAGLLHMKTLDIERDPVEQGFEEASYDLIVASNVIHATGHLHKTLAHIRKLLKPRGKLAMIEITRLTPPYMMSMGLLPGWWKGQ